MIPRIEADEAADGANPYRDVQNGDIETYPYSRAMREHFREILNSQYHNKALDFVVASPAFRNDRFVDR